MNGYNIYYISFHLDSSHFIIYILHIIDRADNLFDLSSEKAIIIRLPYNHLEMKMNIMIIGAHPDDPEVALGGTAALYSELGHRVVMVSLTDGSSGHQSMDKTQLAARRKIEAEKSAKILGAEYVIMDTPDSELTPSVENRKKLIALIRKVEPDIIFTHPLVDYHPDHRYTAQLVMDTSFLLKVPLVVPEVPAMKKDPAILFYRFRTFDDGLRPLVCVPIDSVLEKKILALHQHESQMYEWLPFVNGYEKPAPEGDAERMAYTAGIRNKAYHENAVKFRHKLVERYGRAGENVKHAEVVFKCPVGRQLRPDDFDDCFPFNPGL
jgi:LmbE family N-acetylglucosaminyl deacetylase